MSNTQYLQNSVGKLLSQAIAYTIEQQPSDPVEFLAMYLLHQRQKQEAEEKRKQRQSDELEQQRKDKEELEAAAKKIQAVGKGFLTRKKLAAETQVSLAQELAAKRKQAEEDPIELETEGKEEEMLAIEKNTVLAERRFGATKELLEQKLDIATLESYRKARVPPHKSVPHILRATLLLLGYKWDVCRSWMDIRMYFKPAKVIEKIKEFDPTAEQKAKKFTRVARILKRVGEAGASEASASCHLLYSWMMASIEFRNADITERKAKKEEIVEEPDSSPEHDEVDDQDEKFDSFE